MGSILYLTTDDGNTPAKEKGPRNSVPEALLLQFGD
jgi:hypothetical protein